MKLVKKKALDLISQEVTNKFFYQTDLFQL